MTADEQLKLWVAGDSRCPNDRGECCPDFSCCHAELQTEPNIRAAFAAGDSKTREQLCAAFIVALLELTGYMDR
jgi:hypothetical protein